MKKQLLSRPFNLYTKPLIILTLKVVLISFLLSYYEIELPIRPAISLVTENFKKIPIVKSLMDQLRETFNFSFLNAESSREQARPREARRMDTADIEMNLDTISKSGLPIFTAAQLALFDGSQASKPVYLAILGRIYNVEKGRKHYGVGGGYNFFAGKDATRAFVTGDFTPAGLIDDVSGLSESEILQVTDWLNFYERDYQLVGFLEGTYYNSEGQPTERLEGVNMMIEKAKAWKRKQIQETEVFPPCNSEWKKGLGGRVWCSNKSGGIKRNWVGVPRKLFSPETKSFRCVCVKNFGSPLTVEDSTGTRGDLDHPNLREYEECSPDSNSCKLSSD